MMIDLRWMRPGLAGGIETLARGFLRELFAIDRVNTYTILLPAELRAGLGAEPPNVRTVVFDGPLDLARGLWRALSWKARRRQASVAREPEPDAVLSLSGYVAPDQFGRTNVAIFVDLQHVAHPEFFSAEDLAGRRRVFDATVAHAHRLIAISEHTRQALLAHYGLAAERVSVAHLAAEPSFSAQPQSTDEVFLRRFGLCRGGYILFPANTWRHKNHLGALAALARLRDEHGLRPVLALTGAAREAHQDTLARCHELALDEQVRFLGYLHEGALPALYRGARALFYPSFYEGFGLPAVEAMASACPIVCSDAASLPEVVGDAGILVNPRSTADMASALAGLLRDDAMRAQLVERGRSRLAQFSWRRFTTHVLRVLYQATQPSPEAVA